MKPNVTSIGSWKKAAADFHRRHGNKKYTMTWHQTTETEMLDKSLEKEWRVLAAVRRYAWGNLSDFAVDGMPPKKETDPKPKPLSQDRLAEMLGLPKSSISEACIFLKERGYFRANHEFLYPEDEINLLESEKTFGVNPDSTDYDSPNLRWERYFFSSLHPDLGAKLSDFEAERKTIHEKSREVSQQIRTLKLQALAERRYRERKGLPTTPDAEPDSTETPNKTEVPGTSADPMRLCTDVHIQEEGKANNGIVSTIQYKSGVNPDSEPISSDTPKLQSDTGRITTDAKPLVSRKKSRGPLKPLININTEGAAAATLTTEQETPAPHEPPPPPAALSASENAAHYEQLAVLATQYGIDGPGVDILVTNCRKVRADAIYPEIGHFLEIEAARYQKRGKKVQSLSGLLLTTGVVEANFKGKSFEQYRNRQREAEPAGKEGPTPPRTWNAQGSWEGDKQHWNELDAETQNFYREMFPEECPK